jgi:hypothetical protein
MVDFLNLPHATNTAIQKSIRFIPITGISPVEILKKIASSIMNATPIAAQGVSCGLIRSSEGIIKPMLPMISEKPISLTGNELTSFVHGRRVYKFSTGRNNFAAPVIKNTIDKNTCAAQSAMLKALDGF